MPKSHNYLTKYAGKKVDKSLALKVARDIVKQAQSPSRKVKVRKFGQEHVPALKEFVLNAFRKFEDIYFMFPKSLAEKEGGQILVFEHRAEFSLRENKYGYCYDGDSAVIYIRRTYHIHKSNTGKTIFCDKEDTILDIFLTR